MAAHRYWRVQITENNGAAYSSVCELEMFTSLGGSNQCTGGTPMSSSNYDATWTAAKAFDGVKNTDSGWSTLINQQVPSYIGYDFGSGVTKDIVQIAITARQAAGLTQMPKTFIVQWSDDNVVWYQGATIINQTSWTSNQTRTFDLTITDVAFALRPDRLLNADLTPAVASTMIRGFYNGTGQFKGRVLDGPDVVAGARLRAFDEITGALVHETYTDILGEYTIDGLKENREYIVVCKSPDLDWEQMILGRRKPSDTHQFRIRSGVGEIVTLGSGLWSETWRTIGEGTGGTAATANNYTHRVRISGLPPFSKLKLTIRTGSTSYTMNMSKCYVGLVAADGFNYVTGTQVLFGGVGNLVLNNTNTAVESDEVSLSNPDGHDLIVAIHTSAGNSMWRSLVLNAFPTPLVAQLWHKAGDDAASTSANLTGATNYAGVTGPLSTLKVYGDYNF